MVAAGDSFRADDAAAPVAPACVALVATQARVGPALLRMAGRRGLAPRLLGGSTEAAIRQASADAGTRVIALCLDRIEDGEALRAALAVARRGGRWVVALLAGSGEAAELAPGLPAERLAQSLLEAEGAILAASHRELLDIAFFLASLARVGLPAGPRVAILTGGGGGGVIAADLCGRLGLEVPPLSAATRAALAPLVPAIAATANPVDLTPEMFNEKFYDRFPQVLDVVAADAGVDAIFLPTTFNAPRGNVVAAEVLAAFHARSPKPVLIAANPPPDMQPVFAAAGVAPIADTALAAGVLAKLVARGTLPEPPPRAARAVDVAWPAEAATALPALLAAAGFTPCRDQPGTLPLRLLGFRDAAFGPVLALGAGGVPARVLDDLVLAPAPFDAATARTLLRRSRVVVHAQRMDRGLDLDDIADAVARLSQLVAAAPWRRFLLHLDPVTLRGAEAFVSQAGLAIADPGSPG